jgi:hypothetical protein
MTLTALHLAPAFMFPIRSLLMLLLFPSSASWKSSAEGEPALEEIAKLRESEW